MAFVGAAEGIIDGDVVDVDALIWSAENTGAPISPRKTAGPDVKYDLFLSHLQRNGQDAIISMQMFLQQMRPGIKIFVDLDVDMKGDLRGTLMSAIQSCGAFVFFITDGILNSEWCAQEIRWAVEFQKTIVLVRETDERHGGLDMGVFLKQVPDDLLEVFKNNIAIPWYRQPAFRSVSLQSILKSAAVEDTLAKELDKMQATTAMLQQVFKGSSDPTSAFDVIAQHSWAMRAVFIMGGFAQFKNWHVNVLYVVMFNLSFWFCGSLCCVNLVYQSVPYHVISTDLLTAYVHLPAWQSWLVWRRFVNSRGCDELLTKVMATEWANKVIAQSCRITGWFVLLLQCAMVADVLCGFSLPRTLRLGGEPGVDFGNAMHGVSEFTDLHAFAMWVVIPPVIAAMFASYTMFAFTAMLHFLDVVKVKTTLAECLGVLGSFYKSASPAGGGTPAPCREAQLDEDAASEKSSVSKHSQPSAAGEGAVEDMQAQFRKIALEERLFKAACDLITQLFKRAQQRIDHTCKAIGGLWIHLVFFSTCQVLSIMSALKLHATGGLRMPYTWWWGLQDFFHLGGGLVLLAAAMGVFCVVTSYFQYVRTHTLEILARAGCPPTRQASVMGLLAARPLGMHVLFGTVHIDVPKAAGFFFVLLAFVMNHAIEMFNCIDYD